MDGCFGDASRIGDGESRCMTDEKMIVGWLMHLG